MPVLVQRIVGHSNPSMTEHYGGITEQAAKDATLFIGDGVRDAEFEVLSDPIPDWALELIRKLNTKNVAKIKKQLIGGKA